jgi:glycerophosphoryl diester phosphodiesterase
MVHTKITINKHTEEIQTKQENLEILRKDTILIGHRGFPDGKYADNSFEAYKNAFENNFDMIEMDVQLCKSGEVVIYHDINIGNKLIRDMNYSDLLSNNIKTLTDFFIQMYNNKMKILFDIKGKHDNVVDKILVVCDNFDVDYSNIYISSFNKLVISDLIKRRKMGNNRRNYKIGLISDNNFYYDEINYQLDKLDFISLSFNMLVVSCDDKLMDECNKRKIKIFVWSINNKNPSELLKKIPIDGYISDVKLT